MLPALAVGNIGQLAIDLLLSAYKSQLIGYWYDPNNVMPFAANDVLALKKSDQVGLLSTGIDIHYSPQYKVVILQQRSPLLARRSIPFVTALVAWLRERRVGAVALLTSGPSHKREDKVCQDITFHVIICLCKISFVNPLSSNLVSLKLFHYYRNFLKPNPSNSSQ